MKCLVCKYLALVFFSCVMLSSGFGCASSTAPAVVPPEVSDEQESAIFKEPPLEVSVSEASQRGDKLRVTVQLKPKTTLESQDVAISIFGMKEGLIVEEQVKLASDVLSAGVMESGKTFTIPFELESAGLSEYQVKCTWGSDTPSVLARPGVLSKSDGKVLDVPATVPAEEESEEDLVVAAKTDKPMSSDSIKTNPQSSGGGVELAAVEVEKEEIEDCNTEPCDFFYVLNATLVNKENVPVTKAELALGLYWSNNGDDPAVPEHGAPLTAQEERIPLDSINVAPGASRTVRVRIDRPIPVVSGGEFVPHLRVLDFKAAS